MIFQMEFNGCDFSPYLIVENIRRPIFLTTTHNSVRVGTRPGKRLLNVLIEEQILEVDIRIIEKSREAATQIESLIATNLPINVEGILRLRDRPEIFNKAVVGTVEYEKFRSTGGGTIQFILYDPYNYLNQKSTVTFKNETIIKNTGISDVRPIMQITGASGDHLEVRSITLGATLYVNGAVEPADTVVIDFEEEKILKNGELIMKYLDYNSDFFDLILGDNRLKLSSGTATVEFNRRVM